MRRRCRIRRRSHSPLLLLLAAAALSRCASPRTSASAPAPSPAATAADDLDSVGPLVAFLKETLSLDAAQEVRTRQAALRLVERNNRILAPRAPQRRMPLEALGVSNALFDQEMMTILTAAQLSRYLEWKRQFRWGLLPKPTGRL